MIGVSVLGLVALVATALVGGAGDHGVRSWSTADGLPQNSVLDIAQTPNGVLWLATQAGLVQFDGQTFEIDDVSLTPEFGTSRMLQVEVDSTGTLFVGTARGVVLRMGAGVWQRVDLPCPCSAGIGCLVADEEGAMWIGAKCGAYRVELGASSAQRVSSEKVGSIALGAQGEVYLGSADGIVQIAPEFRKLGSDRSPFVAVDSGGRLYSAQGEGVYRLDGASWSRLPIEVGRIQQVALQADGGLWVCGVGGFGCWDDESAAWRPGPSPLGITTDAAIRCVLFDSSENLWVGTETHGLFAFNLTGLSSLPPTASRHDGILSVAVTSDNRVFALGPPLYELVEGSLVPSDLSVPMGIAPASDGGLWLDTSSGIQLEREGTRELILPVAEYSPGVGAMMEARDGTLWFCRDALLYQWNGSELHGLELTTVSTDFLGTALFEGRDGRIWIGGTTGLVVWDGVEQLSLVSGYELPLGEVRSFYETESGAMWIGTYGSGLCRFQNGQLDLVDVGRGMYENIASALVPDGQGNLLVMGNRAITRYSLSGLDAVASGVKESVRGRVFNSGSGIGIFEGNGAVQPRAAVDGNGAIWFPGLHGLVCYEPTMVPDLGPPPTVRTRCMVYADSKVSRNAKGQRLHSLGSESRDLHVQFSTASFVQPRQVSYRYRLLGREQDWVMSRNEDSVRYSNLPPGTYEFQVQAAVADGEYGPINRSLRIDVPPTTFEKLWVKRLLTLSALLLVCLVAVLRIRTARRDSAKLGVLVRQRTEELQSEIGERMRVEESLREAGESLEAQVERRTEQLSRALDNLENDIREREQLEGRLRESEKLEIVGRLAGGLAHDFNNILTAVLGETDLALFSIEGSTDSETLKPVLVEHLEHVRDSGLRASQLTRQLLAYSRQQVMQPEVIDPLETLKSLLPMLTRLVPDNIELAFSEQLESQTVLIDPGQLEQVIVNLVVNAAEAMPEGGSVVLGCRVNVGEDGTTSTVLTVTDSGTGLLPEVRDHIFEPFFSTKGKARGLGLASVQGIVLQSGGSLYVEEIEGRGLAFHVGFPVTDGTPQEVQPVAELRRVDGVVALLIDDEVEVRRISRLMLEGGGVHVLEARTHEETLGLAREYGSEIDILVTDVVMPQMNGKELSVEVRKLCPEIKVLFISGHFREELSERDLIEPGANFLAKPFDARQLLARVADLTQMARTV